MIKKTFMAIGIALLFIFNLRAQMAGVYTIPGSFTTLASAIASLNTSGVSSAVTVNIAAGYTEIAISGGYTLNAIAGASSTNQIIFQKNGTGTNSRIIAYSGGVGTPSTAVQDGVWRFSGTYYVTVDGIDVLDQNSSNPATMEFGYGFFKASITDGCHHNTIQNCVITLNKMNGASGTGSAGNGSRGIELINATMGAHTTSLAITAASGASSDNKFYANTIQNCKTGIILTHGFC